MTSRPTLLVMAKAPLWGRGKQRLAEGVGKTQALRINRTLHRLTLSAAIDPRWRTVLAVTPRSASTLNLPGIWPPRAHIERVDQGEGTLGERIATAVSRACAPTLVGPICVIGSDAPALRKTDLAMGFRALRRASAVLGAAEDGGFWLVGARDPAGLIAALPGVAWSTNSAGKDIAARLPTPLATLRTLNDIDEVADWRAFVAQRSAWRGSIGT